MVKVGIEFIDKLDSREEKFNLIKTVREATDGKLFVECEYARTTRMYAEMKEADGLVDEATETIQEV